MFVDGNNNRVNINAPCEDGEGTRHLNMHDPAVRALMGVTEIADPVRKDESFYFVQEIDQAPYVVHTAKQLGQIRKAMQAVIDGACEAAMTQLRDGYPESEVLSWSKQETEARAFIADAGAATPLLDNLSAVRGMTKADLAARVIQKADIFAQVSGQVIGTRQKLEDALNALPDEATIETHAAEFAVIKWPGG